MDDGRMSAWSPPVMNDDDCQTITFIACSLPSLSAQRLVIIAWTRPRGNRTIRRQTNSRSVKSRTGKLDEIFDAKFGQIIAPNIIFTNSLSASWPVHKLSSLRVDRSATWLTASWFVGELSSQRSCHVKKIKRVYLECFTVPIGDVAIKHQSFICIISVLE